jgi:F0F1-type ATP synthase assembly protein I
MNDEKQTGRKSGIVYAAVLSLCFSILGFLFVGWMLDGWLETSPWLVLTGIVLGTVAGFVQFIRLMSRIS